MAVFSATHSISAEQTATSNTSRKGFFSSAASRRTHRRRLRRSRSSKKVHRHLVWSRQEPVIDQGIATRLTQLQGEIAILKFRIWLRETKMVVVPHPPATSVREEEEQLSSQPAIVPSLLDEEVPIELARAFPTVFWLRKLGLPILSLCACAHHYLPPVVAEQTALTKHTADTHKTSAKSSVPLGGGSSGHSSGDIMAIAQKYFSVSVRVVHRTAAQVNARRIKDKVDWLGQQLESKRLTVPQRFAIRKDMNRLIVDQLLALRGKVRPFAQGASDAATRLELEDEDPEL